MSKGFIRLDVFGQCLGSVMSTTCLRMRHRYEVTRLYFQNQITKPEISQSTQNSKEWHTLAAVLDNVYDMTFLSQHFSLRDM
jgi:hypothetical protein